MEVVCGSYESMVFGCKLRKTQQEYDFELSFCDNSHGGNVKAVAVSENGILATGSSDETIKLKSLKARKEMGSISHHEGTITALAFYGKTHLFSASEDGTIVIWKVGSWESLKVLKGHKSAVYDVAVHPSGKMAVSVSKDKTMRTWNLITGRAAFVTNIKIAADNVIWMPNGERYIVLHDRTMDIYGVESGKLEHTITHETRINSISFIEDGILLAAGEGGVVFFYNTEDYSKVYEFSTETVRVKGMHCCASEESGAVWLVTGSADGMLKLWTLTSPQGKWSHRLDVSKDFGYRITSMVVRVDRAQLEGEKNVNNNKASTSDSKENKKRKKKQQNQGKRANEDGEEKQSKKKRKVQIEEELTADNSADDDEEEEEFLTRKTTSNTAVQRANGECPRKKKSLNRVDGECLERAKSSERVGECLKRAKSSQRLGGECLEKAKSSESIDGKCFERTKSSERVADKGLERKSSERIDGECPGNSESSERIDGAVPRKTNSVEASISEFMKQKLSLEKLNEEVDNDENDTDKESVHDVSRESSKTDAHDEDEGSDDSGSSDSTIDFDILRHVDCLDSIEEVDEEEYIRRELRERQLRQRGLLDDLPDLALDFQVSVSRKESKRSTGTVSPKTSKKTLVSLKASNESLVSPKVSKDSLASVSKKASKESVASVSRKPSKESVPVSAKSSMSSNSALPAGDSSSTSKRAKKAQQPKNQSPKKKLASKNGKESKSQIKSQQNKKSLKNGANKLKKSESQPLSQGKTKQRKKVKK